MAALPMASRLFPIGIPLHCNICPKKPDFSDVSHLLTHIASKGHLSTYYKIKVKASSEESSRKLIQEYDSWYANWSIEDLMSDRLSLKEKRKSKSRSTSGVTSAPMPLYQIPPPYAFFAGANPYDHAMDSRLTPHVVKTEAASRSTTPMHAPYIDPSAFQDIHYVYGNPVPSWNPAAYLSMQTRQDADHEIPSAYLKQSPATFHADKTLIVDGADDIEATADSNKLKGVFWPGMDMFDAAPPEQRRKRNQKKDTSVVEHLEAMSRMIDATEHIFSPCGTHCKSRPISGLPDSDDSPLPGEETPPRPKRAKRAPRRKPLAEKDPNTGRQPASKPQKRGRPAKKVKSVKQEKHTPTGEVATNAVNVRKRRKGALSVYRDGEVTFDQPADMDLLNSAFRPPSPQQTADVKPDIANRPKSNEPPHIAHQAYYPYHGYYTNPFALEPAVLPSWDYYAGDTSSAVANPLFLDTEQNGGDSDDDEQTISVPGSEL